MTASAARLEEPSGSLKHVIDRLIGAGTAELHWEIVRAARTAGDRVLLREGRRTMTGSQIAAALDRLPRALVQRGMSSGQTVLFGVRPGIDGFLMLLGCMRTGACVTFVDPGAGDELFARRMELLGPSWVVAESLLYAASARTPLRPLARRMGLGLPRLGRMPGQHVRVGPRLPGVPRSRSMRRLLADTAADTVALPALPDVDAANLIIFTSGTTGEPKGVQHTGRSMTAAIRLFATHFDLPVDSVLYNHNIHSFVMAILAGLPTVVEPMRFQPKRFLADVERHCVTHTFGLPVDAWALVQDCERREAMLPESLRTMILYSAPVTTGVLERMHALAGPDLRILCVYAMTEMAPVAWIDSRDKCAWTGAGDVVGPICPDVEHRIDSADQLLLRGDNAHRGYFGIDPARIEWLPTGDLARVDADGNLVLMGRDKDMIIRGDFNLYPGLYEHTVCRIDGVAACAFVGDPDPLTGDERVVLFVESDSGSGVPAERLERDVAKALRGNRFGIDRSAWPDQVRVVEALPRSGRSSKIDRRALRLDAGGGGRS